MSDDVMYWPRSRHADARGVVVIAVNYNTRDLIAVLLWSIHRALRDRAQCVLVVDNGSTDGSRALLEGCREAGLCELIANDANRYHGPALNQAMSHLAAREGDALSERPRWVWLLDSDCVVVRADVLTDVISEASSHRAALVGERWWDPWHDCDRLALHSLLIDPRASLASRHATVWRRRRPGL
jgi:GT2 family glycosyltransferase